MNKQSTKYIFAENVLLLGAGFTKNFGGLLADEMWAEIFNHEKVQAQQGIRNLLLRDFDFESVYYSVFAREISGSTSLPSIFTDEEKDAIKVATLSAYEYMDKVLIEHITGHPLPVHLNYVTELISCIRTQRQKNEIIKNGTKYFIVPQYKEKCFIFTLNQDLFFERLYHKNASAELSIPGIDNDSEWFTTYFNRPLTKKDYRILPTNDELISIKDTLLEKGNFFLIKLHGSYNWKSSNGSDLMVIGRSKQKQIVDEPLLSYYFEIFKEVLSQYARRLLVIGYGFGDRHINREISNAIRDHNLKIYILSPESPNEFRKKVQEDQYIWRGVAGYFQCVNEVLKSEYAQNQIAREHFYNIFFGENKIS